METKKIRAFLLLFCFLCMAGTGAYAQNADINILKKINLERNRSLDGGMKFITNSSEPLSLVLTAGILAKGYLSKNREYKNKGWEMAASGATAFVLAQGMKIIINRSRPIVKYPFIDAYDRSLTQHSFPSGHTTAAFNTATTLSLEFKKWYIVVPAYLWAATVGYSRLHLGVHYPSDVLAGAITGAGSAYLTHKIYNWYLHKKQKR